MANANNMFEQESKYRFVVREKGSQDTTYSGGQYLTRQEASHWLKKFMSNDTVCAYILDVGTKIMYVPKQYEQAFELDIENRRIACGNYGCSDFTITFIGL